MGEEDEQMQTQDQIAALNRALVLQNRSALQYSLTAGSLLGFEYAGITGELASFAQAELEDARHLVEKIVALEALQDAIAFTGRDATSEALEHRLEHTITRKQEQVDALIRASRT